MPIREQSAVPATTQLGELCLGYLAENPEALAAFMAETGYDGRSLMAARGTPALASGLIDHFARNEPLLLALCSNAGIAPERFMAVWQRLNPQS
ncbi:Protein of unknown function [Devosia enhydra]|uniref:DUF3572 domain-containing protein n=1 Tax=Devosia enhydra TaxID=665118 RepID=A0A1K2HU93_9HYPH|nr:DUF3572 family protein [Devosia enhydra]SFZ81942.1 Protein of unknown function [Devosia enhydra]